VPPILVTGAAGFIGHHVAAALLAAGHEVVGLDNLNDYYSVELKKARLARIERPGFTFVHADVSDAAALRREFDQRRFRRVVHLAAQAGVRYSLVNPQAYVAGNLVGFANVLECCRHLEVEHLVYASSSSVYGANTTMPFSVHQNVDHPLSLYAATKKANELMAHSYAHIFRVPSTGLRFFTVYGPWGRPDMAMYLFTDAILAGRPVDLFNGGVMQRDFTYVDDIVESIVRLLDRAPTGDPAWDSDHPDPGSSRAPYRIYNIGNHRPVQVEYVIELLERELGTTAQRRLLPMQAGDVPATYADIDDLARDVGFSPATPIEEGVRRFVAWFREYHRN
jgi:UDP-glucuronate 4-epimerase